MPEPELDTADARKYIDVHESATFKKKEVEFFGKFTKINENLRK